MEVTDLGECYLHLKVYKWNKQAMKQLKTLWPIVKKQLKESGYTCVRSIIPFSDKKAQRFQTFMGLEEDQVYYGKGFKTYKGEL